MPVIRRRVVSAAVVTAFLGACGLNAATEIAAPEPSPEVGPPPRQLLFLAPGPENDERYLPAFRGAEVSLAVASLTGPAIDLAWVELPTDASSWTPPEAAGAIIAPGTPADILADLRGVLEVPTVSLAGGDHVNWRALVTDTPALASTMLGAAGERPCLVPSSDRSDIARVLRRSEIRELALDEVVDDAASLLTCTAVLWTGSADGVARLDAALADAGAGRVTIIGTDAIRYGSLEGVVAGAGRILIVSGAIDVSTGLDLRSRRFVQDYQSQVGLPPGPFSAEAWDAAALLTQVIRDGGRWPETFSGMGGIYDLAGEGEPRTYIYREANGGWRYVSGG